MTMLCTCGQELRGSSENGELWHHAGLSDLLTAQERAGFATQHDVTLNCRLVSEGLCRTLSADERRWVDGMLENIACRRGNYSIEGVRMLIAESADMVVQLLALRAVRPDTPRITERIMRAQRDGYIARETVRRYYAERSTAAA